MAANVRMVDNEMIVWAAEPKNYSSAAATEKYMSLKNYNHVTFIIQTGAWAGGTAAVTLNQATTVAGGSKKALSFSKQWTNQSNTSTDLLVETAVASNTFNLNTANTIYVIEVDAATLDVANGFDCISLVVASPGGNADLYGAIAVFSGSRYHQAALPTTLVD